MPAPSLPQSPGSSNGTSGANPSAVLMPAYHWARLYPLDAAWVSRYAFRALDNPHARSSPRAMPREAARPSAE